MGLIKIKPKSKDLSEISSTSANNEFCQPFIRTTTLSTAHESKATTKAKNGTTISMTNEPLAAPFTSISERRALKLVTKESSVSLTTPIRPKKGQQLPIQDVSEDAMTILSEIEAQPVIESTISMSVEAVDLQAASNYRRS